jgi:hypothetical protein
VAECLPSKCKALSSNLVTKRREGRREGGRKEERERERERKECY